MVMIIPNENGNRVYVFGKRLHHGTTGIIGTLICLKMKQYKIACVFLGMIWHDRADFPFRDCDNH